jgi:hypothetical protein
MLRCTIVILALTAVACGHRAADQPAAGRSDTVPPAARQVADSALPLGPEDFVVAGLTSQTDDTTAVRARLSSPDSVTVYAGGRGVTWHYRDLVVSFGGSATGLRFTLTGPGVATARGLRVGDAAERVLALYGEPYVRDEDAWTYVASDSGGDVNAIEVQLRGRRVVSIAFAVWVD